MKASICKKKLNYFQEKKAKRKREMMNPVHQAKYYDTPQQPQRSPPVTLKVSLFFKRQLYSISIVW